MTGHFAAAVDTLPIKLTLSPKRPKGSEWRQVSHVLDRGSFERWVSGPILVLSECSVMEMPDGGGEGPQWLISISNHGKRPKPHHVRRALRAFGMTEAEEDNHERGAARKFFLVVDPARRVACECKDTETIHVDPDGYRWSSPREEM